MATAEETGQDGIPRSESERRIWTDIDWAEHDPEVRAKYAGQWIAVFDREVVAHGSDREQVLTRAQAAHRPPEELAVWPILNELALLTDSPASVSEL